MIIQILKENGVIAKHTSIKSATKHYKQNEKIDVIGHTEDLFSLTQKHFYDKNWFVLQLNIGDYSIVST